MTKLLLATLVAVLATGSNTPGDESIPKTQVHVIFLGWYDKERVELYSADKKIYSSVITTEPTSGTAGFADVPAPTTPLRLKVSIPRLKMTRGAELAISKGKFFYVSFDHNQLTFQQTKIPLALD